MKLRDIYELAVSAGIDVDPRGREAVAKLLSRERDLFDKLSEKEKTYYDEARLANPYADTRILAGDHDTEVASVLVGVDMETAEILLADRLREKGRRVDLVMSHHPEGPALAALGDVMGVQADIWHRFGVPINVGDQLIGKRAKEVERGLSPINHSRPVDAAKLLGIPYMCVHTPADNHVSTYLQDKFDAAQCERLEDVVELLKDIPEYAHAAKINSGPNIIVGEKKRRAGKVIVMMTGGTGGPEESIEKLAQAGVGTLIEMHLQEKLREKAEQFGLNVVIAGHIASDSLGLNLLLDNLEAKGVEIIPASGLIRVRRGA